MYIKRISDFSNFETYAHFRLIASPVKSYPLSEQLRRKTKEFFFEFARGFS